MVSSAVMLQLDGYRLTTAEIHYRFSRCCSSIAGRIMTLRLAFPNWVASCAWDQQIEAKLHTVRVADQHLIAGSEWRVVDGVLRTH